MAQDKNAAKGAALADIAARMRKKLVQFLVIATATAESRRLAAMSQGARVEKRFSAASGSSQRRSQPSVLRFYLTSAAPCSSTPVSALTQKGSSASSLAFTESRRPLAVSSAPQSAKVMDRPAAPQKGRPQPAVPTA